MPADEDNKRGIGSRRNRSQFNIKFGTNYLLVIGIDSYSNGVPVLRNAVKDAEAFKNLLIESYKFEEENTYSLFNEEATRANIFKVMGELVRDKIKEEDSLVFYFSGHGEYVDYFKEGYWLPVDAVSSDVSTYLSNDDVSKLMNATKARHVLGIVDSCFSGSFITRSTKSANLIKRFISKPSRWIITSGQLEVVSDGSLGDNSPFAKLLLSRLRNNTDDGLWVSKLGEGIREGFNYNSQKQVPDFAALLDSGHEGGQFVFLRKNVSWEFALTAEKEEINSDTQSYRGETANDDEQQTLPPQTESQPEPEPTPEKDWAKLPLKDLKNDLKMMVATGEIPKVFDILNGLLSNNSLQMTILVRMANYKDNKKAEMEGTEDARSLRTSYAQIRNAFISVINKMDEGDLSR